MVALEARGVVRSYGKGNARREVLRDFSLTLAPHEFVALMGPSGSGKTTFLHLAAGLLLPEAGTIDVGGRRITSMGDAAATRFRRECEGVVFQSDNLIETLTVAENVVLPARLARRRIDRARLAGLLACMGLADRGDSFPSGLSGGERQRVAFARALFLKPALILADEPTGNLDARASAALCALLAESNRTEGVAVLLVTHDPVVAASASRVCFLKDGRLVGSFEPQGDPAAVSAAYLEHCR